MYPANKSEKTEIVYIIQVDESEKIQLTRDKFQVLYDTRSNARIVEINKRAEMFYQKTKSYLLTITEIRMLLFRTETCIQASAAMGALSRFFAFSILASSLSLTLTRNEDKQNDVSVAGMHKHIRKHIPDIEDNTVAGLALWAQHEGPLHACDILSIPEISLDELLDDRNTPINLELLVENGKGKLRDARKEDVISYVLLTSHFANKNELQAGIKCISTYADIFARIVMGHTIPSKTI